VAEQRTGGGWQFSGGKRTRTLRGYPAEPRGLLERQTRAPMSGSTLVRATAMVELLVAASRPRDAYKPSQSSTQEQEGGGFWNDIAC
jgi:hypothetical protein